MPREFLVLSPRPLQVGLRRRVRRKFRVEKHGVAGKRRLCKAKCENGNMKNDGLSTVSTPTAVRRTNCAQTHRVAVAPKKYEVREGPPPGGHQSRVQGGRGQHTAKGEGRDASEQGRVQGVCDSKGASYADTGMWAGGGSAGNKATAKKMAPGCLFWTDSGGKTVRYNAVGQGSCATPHFNYRCVRRSRRLCSQ